MKQLFEYAVILHEYETIAGGQLGAVSSSSVRNYKDSKLIIEPKRVLAKNEKDLLFKVTREIPEEFTGNPDDIQILIRPF